MLLDTLPNPRTPDSMDAPPLRWGVLGTGWIAERFTSAVRAHTRQEVYAVGSRTQEGADRFAAQVAAGGGVPTAYGSYEALVADPAVDVVYVATPHNYHHPHARLALEAGKATLVEKPMGLDAAQVQDLADLAASRGLFLMEAMWTLFLPKFDVIRQVLEAGSLGTLHAVIADMGERFEPDHRIMRADLAGGPLNDLGTYPLTLATWVLGEPDQVAVVRTVAPPELSPSGVDGQVGIVTRTAADGVAALHTTLLAQTPTAATIAGSRATLVMEGPFYQPGGFTLTPHGGTPLRYEEERVAHAGLHWEAAEVARCVSRGHLASPLRPVADTIVTMRTMDAVRAALSRR